MALWGSGVRISSAPPLQPESRGNANAPYSRSLNSRHLKPPTFYISEAPSKSSTLQITFSYRRFSASDLLSIPKLVVLRIRFAEKPAIRSCLPDGDFLPSQFSLTRFLCRDSGCSSLRVPESMVLRRPRFVGWALLLLVSCWSVGGGAGNVGV